VACKVLRSVIVAFKRRIQALYAALVIQLVVLKHVFACENHYVLVVRRKRDVAQNEARSGVTELLKRDAFLFFVVPHNYCVVYGVGHACQRHELLFIVVLAEVNRDEFRGIVFVRAQDFLFFEHFRVKGVVLFALHLSLDSFKEALHVVYGANSLAGTFTNR